MNTRRWTLVLVVTAMVLPMTLVASAGQVVDFTDLTRQTAGYHVDMINPGAPTPWGDYSSPVFGSQPVSGCFSGSQDRTTSYGSSLRHQPRPDCLDADLFHQGPRERRIHGAAVDGPDAQRRPVHDDLSLRRPRGR